MNGFLIDTNVLSEYNRPGVPDAGVKRWLETTARELHCVSVITLAEIAKGIELLGDGKRAMRHSSPETKRGYQLGMVEQVRQNLEKANLESTGAQKYYIFITAWRLL